MTESANLTISRAVEKNEIRDRRTAVRDKTIEDSLSLVAPVELDHDNINAGGKEQYQTGRTKTAQRQCQLHHPWSRVNLLCLKLVWAVVGSTLKSKNKGA